MPRFSGQELVNVTIDSVVYSIPRGIYSLKELAALISTQQSTGPDTITKYASMTLVSGVSPAQASPGANGSVALYGGEVLTSVIGS